ncbi:hypothetical protein GOBAR_DD34217 [Gossypium barbadense]|nr:hypothetical protein GOBAR_DD34217 [Gossypium barbadense]
MNDFSSGFHPPAVPGHETKLSAEEKQPAARCEWDFSLATVVSSTAKATVSDTLGVIEFDPSNTILATGGIARKIRIYTLNSLLRPQEETVHFQGEHQSIAFLDHTNACGNCIFTPAKLSSLRWKPGTGGRILGSGDYDGVVMEYDVETKVPIFERDEHGGRRVWSVDYSHSDPFLGASGSDDGTMQMWDPRCGEVGGSVAKVQPTKSRSSVCCVEFNPFGDALIAAGCADQKAYAYDVRKMVEPVHIFDGHTKTITYVRFLNAQTLVSAGTDGGGGMEGCLDADQKITRCSFMIPGGVSPFGCMASSLWVEIAPIITMLSSAVCAGGKSMKTSAHLLQVVPMEFYTFSWARGNLIQSSPCLET